MRQHTDRTTPGGTYSLCSRSVARVGYGAMQLRSLAADPAKAQPILSQAIDLGVTHIDTAHFYGDGFVNQMIHEAIADRGVLVATKIGAVAVSNAKAPLRLAQHPKELRGSVEANLTSLGVERLALVNLRRADAGPGLRAEGDQIVPIEDQIAELLSLQTQGKIASIGLSGVGLDGLERALSAGIVCVQNAYSLVSREDEILLTFCHDHDIAWVPFFPLGGAFPGWPKVTERPEVIALAQRLDATPSQVGLAWLLRHKSNILLIPGTANAAHLQENVACAALVLDDSMVTELEDTTSLDAGSRKRRRL